MIADQFPEYRAEPVVSLAIVGTDYAIVTGGMVDRTEARLRSPRAFAQAHLIIDEVARLNTCTRITIGRQSLPRTALWYFTCEVGTGQLFSAVPVPFGADYSLPCIRSLKKPRCFCWASIMRSR